MATTLSHKLNARNLILKIFPAAVFLVLFLLFVHWSKESSPNRADTKLKELQQLAAEVRVPSSFREVATHSSSRGMDAGVYKSYHSLASFEEVKKFYSDQLIARGWVLAAEENHESRLIDTDGKDVEFQKGDMIISIEYAGSKVDDRSWNYSVSYVWRNS